MAEISEAAKMKAKEIADATLTLSAERLAFAHFIQQVSDAAKNVDAYLAEWTQCGNTMTARECLAPFILPEPVDPVIDALTEMSPGFLHPEVGQMMADSLREALGKRGLKIVEDKS